MDKYREKWTKFTYSHYLEPDNEYVLQVGLVGCFYLNQAYLSEKRDAMM